LHTPDAELAARFITTGDEDAFRLLFRRHTPRLYALALRLMGGNRADAEDVVQEAWQRAAARLTRFEWRSSLLTWMSAIVINCARERLRKRAPDAIDPDALDRMSAGAHGEPGIDLERAIAALPDGYREVLVLHDVEGHTHAEIAQMLGVAAGTSKSQLFHARRAVRARLAGTPPEADHDDG
jgi:RNA polymerase sigma-70 factor (ECF subfamily)